MANPELAPLPKYDQPPVVETVLGIEFVPLAKWDVPHFGMFWNEIEADFPDFEVKPPLGSKIENFGPPVRRGAEVQLLTKPELRCWFVSEKNQRLVQVQHDRFIYNWRKGELPPYPHYDASIRGAFESELQRFASFVQRRNLGPIEVVQCEVTYVNHLEIGTGWSTPADLHNVFRCWADRSSAEFLPEPEGIAWDVRYRLPDDQGRLHANVRPAIKNADGSEILQFTLTARGQPPSDDVQSALKWIDMGREWVVRGFTDLTTAAMHTLWKRKV